MLKNFKHIIWDWNGTLFDDIDVCVENINWLLQKYNLKPITKEKYREIFTFPVIEYYRRAGFDLQKLNFKEIGKEWIDRYEEKKFKANLSEGAREIIKLINSRGIEQSILSAYSKDSLTEIVLSWGLTKYFKYIVGLDNIYAESKINLGKKLMNQLNLIPDHIVLIGDTVHDYEVSLELNCRCILIASGHQTESELEKCNVPVYKNLKSLLNELNESEY